MGSCCLFFTLAAVVCDIKITDPCISDKLLQYQRYKSYTGWRWQLQKICQSDCQLDIRQYLSSLAKYIKYGDECQLDVVVINLQSAKKSETNNLFHKHHHSDFQFPFNFAMHVLTAGIENQDKKNVIIPYILAIHHSHKILYLICVHHLRLFCLHTTPTIKSLIPCFFTVNPAGCANVVLKNKDMWPMFNSLEFFNLTVQLTVEVDS